MYLSCCSFIRQYTLDVDHTASDITPISRTGPPSRNKIQFFYAFLIVVGNAVRNMACGNMVACCLAMGLLIIEENVRAVSA